MSILEITEEQIHFVLAMATVLHLAMIALSILLYVWLGFIYKAPEDISWQEQRWGSIEKIRTRVRKSLYEQE